MIKIEIEYIGNAVILYMEDDGLYKSKYAFNNRKKIFSWINKYLEERIKIFDFGKIQREEFLLSEPDMGK